MTDFMLRGGFVSAFGALLVSGVAALGCEGAASFSPGVALGVVTSSQIKEASGLAVSWTNPGVVWTHNDGSDGRLFALTTDGVLLATFVPNKKVEDAEDIAVGPGPLAGLNYIYFGDIGSNQADRSKVRVLRSVEPSITAGAVDPSEAQALKAEVLTLEYPDGKYNAEALIVDPRTGDILVTTKQIGFGRVYLAAANSLVAGTTVPLVFVAEIPINEVSGGAISRDGSEIIFRREDMALIWTRGAGESIGAALSRPGAATPVIGFPNEPNGEAVAFLPDGSGYLTLSEGKDQPIYFFARNRVTPTLHFGNVPEMMRDGVKLRISGCSVAEAIVEGSSDLRSWTHVGTVPLNGTDAEFVDREGSSSRFYRLRQKID